MIPYVKILRQEYIMLNKNVMNIINPFFLLLFLVINVLIHNNVYVCDNSNNSI